MLKKIYKEIQETQKAIQEIKEMLEFMPQVRLFRKPYSKEVHALIKLPEKDEYVFMKPYDEKTQTFMFEHDSAQRQQTLNHGCKDQKPGA